MRVNVENGNGRMTVTFPPIWCSRSCGNNMNQLCIEDCSPARDARHFDLKPDVTIQDLPPFPMQEFMDSKPYVRTLMLGLYQAKETEAIKKVLEFLGMELRDATRIRPPVYSKRSSHLLAYQQESALQAADEERNQLHSLIREKVSLEGKRIEALGGSQNRSE
jgi:hypothetical protein